jgi:hypothetical protein
MRPTPPARKSTTFGNAFAISGIRSIPSKARSAWSSEWSAWVTLPRAWNRSRPPLEREDGHRGRHPAFISRTRPRVFRPRPEKALEAFREGRSIDPQPAFFEEMSRAYSGIWRPGRAAISLLEGLAVYAGRSDLASKPVDATLSGGRARNLCPESRGRRRDRQPELPAGAR